MSYPRSLWTLIVEDDPDSESYYKDMFRRLESELPVTEPVFAHSFSEAEMILESENIFHLVIIDLRIPRKNGQPPSDDDLLGTEVLRACGTRSRLPIPAVLVSSAVLGQASDQLDLRDRIATSFAVGGVIAKGEVFENLRRILLEVLAYLDIGVLLRDSGKEAFPTITAGEEDLIRRALLQQKRVGVDLRWWSASRFSSYGGMSGGWTKVLWG